MTKEEWLEVKRSASAATPDPGCAGCADPSIPDRHTCYAYTHPLAGFAGFGCSFGGCYFSGWGGYSRPKYRDPVGSVRAVYAKQAAALSKVSAYHCADYAAVYGLFVHPTLAARLAEPVPDCGEAVAAA